MKITLQEDDGIAESENRDVTLSDDGFDVPGWVTITVGKSVADIHIDELHHACIALYSNYRKLAELNKKTFGEG